MGADVTLSNPIEEESDSSIQLEVSIDPVEDKRISKTIGVYNKFSKQYADYTFERLLQYPLMQFTSMLPRKAKILDIGCASGRDVQYFLEEGFKPIGIDAAEDLISEAKKRVKKGKFKLMDMQKIDYKNNTFDGVWCHATFCHLLKQSSVSALREMRRVLKQDGLIYIGLREGRGEKMVGYKETAYEPMFFAFYTQVELEAIMHEAGFSIIKSYSERDEQSAWINIFARKI